MKSYIGVVICLVAVPCFTLTLGLTPFHSPRNEVTWLGRSNGLALGKHGTVLSSGRLVVGPQPEKSHSIEIWLQPALWSRSTFLALYSPERNLLFTLQQSLTDLKLQTEFQNDWGRAVKPSFYVDEAFGPALRGKKSVFITLVSAPQGSLVYINGESARATANFSIPEDAFKGRLIVGDSARRTDSFPGQIHGLGIYNSPLSGDQVLEHYRMWTVDGPPHVDVKERCIALYLFDERAGSIIHNRAAPGPDLYIPQTYAVVDKIAMEPFWKEFDFSRSYWSGNLKNIVGFMPAGFCFYAYFVARRTKRPVLITILLGVLMSVTIEAFQALLPTRDSGTTDLITNAIGTYGGAWCYKETYPIIVQRFPWLGWLAEPRY